MNTDRANVGSHYNRFAKSHRAMHGNTQKMSSEPMPVKAHLKYHRNGATAVERTMQISDEMKRIDINETPSAHKYHKPTMFDPEKAQIVKAGYRDINVPPLENLNLNPNKWKPKVTYYNQENKGDVIRQPGTNGYNEYKFPSSTKHEVNGKLLGFQSKFFNDLNLVNTDLRLLNQRYREKLTSRTIMTKLPVHDNEVYAVHELARSEPTNKSIMVLARNAKLKNQEAFGNKKYTMQNQYPIPDFPKRKNNAKWTNYDRPENNKYNANNDNKKANTLNKYLMMTPKHAKHIKPHKYQKNIESLDVNNYRDNVGGVSRIDNNTKSGDTLKQQIASVYERNKNTVNYKYPDISPVFGCKPRAVNIENNPVRKSDPSDYFQPDRKNNYPVMDMVKRRPNFMDLLNMSKKLDIAARIGK
jgi:hypothetical protein